MKKVKIERYCSKKSVDTYKSLLVYFQCSALAFHSLKLAFESLTALSLFGHSGVTAEPLAAKMERRTEHVRLDVCHKVANHVPI